MSFAAGYNLVRPTIVAIAPKFAANQTDFPEIMGTGFFISTHGVVCTCRHVVEACMHLPAPAGFAGFKAVALLFTEVEDRGSRVWGSLAVDVDSHGFATLLPGATGYRGPNPPDVAFLLLKLSGTPAVRWSAESAIEGESVAFAGFPMGTRMLKAPGWLHQVSPTLHSGIVAAVLPHPLAQYPHAFHIHANTQGGASGSPVFRENGEVVGMVYSGIKEQVTFGSENGVTSYVVPTAITGCVPATPIRGILTEVERQAAAVTGRPAFSDVIARARRVEDRSGVPWLEPWPDNLR